MDYYGAINAEELALLHPHDDHDRSGISLVMQQKKPHKMSVLFCSLGQTVN